MKPLVKTATGAAVLLLALSACASKTAQTVSQPGGGHTFPPLTASSTDGETGSTPPATTAPTSSTPQPAGGTSSSVPGSKPTASNGDQVKYTSPDGVSVSADGRTLSTPVTWGGCTDQPQLLVTTQDATQVIVELKTVSHYRMGIMCPNIARNGESSTTLSAPLGSRQLIDGVTHSAIPTH